LRPKCRPVTRPGTRTEMSGRDRFFLVFRAGADVVHEEELDFNSLIHDVAFSAVCEGRLPNDGRWDPVRVEPEWADGTLEAIVVSVAGSSRTYGRAIFRDRAVEILQTRDVRNDRQANEPAKVSWGVEVRQAESEAGRHRRRASVRRQAYPLRAMVDGARQQSRRDTAASMLVTASLLAELREESANSLDRERADFLIGHLVQELDGRATVVLLGRIPADTEAGGSLVHFSFSPRTFQAAQQALERHGSDQVILGWHHNHPPPCGRQCLMTVPACGTDNVLFSFDDRVVHRSAFSRPYMVALVSGKGSDRRADDPVFRAYGWRRGLIGEKEWSILEAAAHHD
jgi:hypothetical protein